MEAKTAHGNTALHLVCRRASDTLVKELLHYGADANTKNHHGQVRVDWRDQGEMGKERVTRETV